MSLADSLRIREISLVNKTVAKNFKDHSAEKISEIAYLKTPK